MPGSESAFLRTVSISATPRGRALASPKRRFWLIVGLITLGGAILRLLTHDYGLPYIEYIDELILWFFGQNARGLESADIYGGGATYPPLFVWLHQLVQPFTEAQGRPHAVDAILDLRRLVLPANVAGIVLSATLGRRCGGALAGIVAASLWAFAPVMLDIPIHAIGESLALPLLLLTVLLAICSLDSGRHRWRLAWTSLITGALCFLLEYRLLVALFPGAAALFLLARAHYRPERRRLMIWSIVGIALTGLASVSLLGLLPANFQRTARNTLQFWLWDIETLARYTYDTAEVLNVWLVLAILALALLSWLARVPYRLSEIRGSAPGLTSVTMVLVLWAGSAIRPYGPQLDLADHVSLRHQIPAIVLLFVILGAALAQIVAVIPGRRLQQLAAVAITLLIVAPNLQQSLEFVQDRMIDPWPVIVRPWVDDNLEPGTILIYDESERWFNPHWGGIPHRKWFDWWETADVLERPLQEWIDVHKISWLVLPVHKHRQLQESAEGRDFLARLLLLRNFTSPLPRRESQTILYRLWRMQHETDVRFGDHIRLTGYDLHTPEPQPGSPLDITLYWNATTTPPANYSFFLHLVGADDPRPLAQIDGNPAVPARLTQTWDRPEETLISPRFSLPLPDDLPPGDYRVMLGLYNFETGERLPVRDASGAPPGDSRELLRLGVADDGTATMTEILRATQ